MRFSFSLRGSCAAPSRLAMRLALTGAAASLLAGCANSERLANAFSNPFESSSSGTDSTPTGSLGGAYQRSAPVTPVHRQALGAAIPQSGPVAVQAQSLPTPAVAPTPAVPRAVAGGAAGWTIEGGTPVVVRQGESAAILARRYGVPTDNLVRANGFGSATEIQPGTRVIIPVYNAALAASSGAHMAQNAVQGTVQKTTQLASRTATAAAELPSRLPTVPKPAALAQQAEPVRQARNVAQSATRSAQAEANAVKGAARAGLAQGHAQEQAVVQHAKEIQTASAQAQSRLASQVKAGAAVPQAMKTATLAKAETAAKAATGKVEHVQTETKKAVKSAMLETPREVKLAEKRQLETQAQRVEQKAARAVEQPAAEPAEAPAPAKASVSDSANPEFRWPARGRIIQAFKPGGNDGINIAVPEGTAVKAAEGGVVAYAGSELKGYGNLVLIRHPNGFVSAYANNGDLEVKRGETVKRGQTIAKSGQSGNVTSPQLHFELRKGATPVDPTQYLAGL